MLINTITKLCTYLRASYQPAHAILSNSSMHTIAQATTTTHSSLGSIAGGAWSLLPIRTNIRNNFPRPKETKRIKVHGWVTRMSTPAGRRTIMRRILKGRHVLSH